MHAERASSVVGFAFLAVDAAMCITAAAYAATSPQVMPSEISVESCKVQLLIDRAHVAREHLDDIHMLAEKADAAYRMASEATDSDMPTVAKHRLEQLILLRQEIQQELEKARKDAERYERRRF